LNTLARRLLPGQDLYDELILLAQEEALEAAVILSAVGSFSQAALRFADQGETSILPGPLEIVSITGTVSRHGLHVHVSVSDKNGTTVGGHLTEGSSVYTTIELVLLDLSQSFTFERALCPHSKFEEVLIKPKNH
jgi:predicted DNA-binding protein with PD1-like motif